MAAAERRGRPRQVSDDQIFDAVSEVVASVGPAGLTLSAVGAKVGLTGPALGYRFKSKHGLLVAFAGAQPEATARRFDRVQAQADSPRKAIVETLVSMVQGLDSKRAVANNLAMLHLDLTDDELGRFATEQAAVIRQRLDQLLRQAGVAAASQRADVVDDLYVIWSGAITTWAIDGRGSLASWVQSRLKRYLDREVTS